MPRPTLLLGSWVRRFLLEHLIAERNLARNTQKSYRDTLALLLPFISAKKRKAGVYRPVPVPPAFLDMLNMVHNIRVTQKRRDRGKSVRLWKWSRTKG